MRLYDALRGFKLNDPTYNEASRKAGAYSSMLRLSVYITIIALNNGSCVAEIKAQVEISVEAKTRNTCDQMRDYAYIDLWSSEYWWKGPQSSFDQDILDVSDRLINEFVNEWTKVQNSP